MKKIFLTLLFLGILSAPVHSVEATYEDAVQLYRQGEYKNALKIIGKIEAKNEKTAAICLLKYEIYKNTGKRNEAKKELKDALNYDENCYEACIMLAIMSIEDNDPKSGRIYFEKAMEIEPELLTSPDILYYYSKICTLEGDLDSALENILSAIEENGDEENYYLELGKIYYKKQDYLKAVNALEYALGGNDNLNAECFNYLGLSNYKRGNYKQALNYFEKAVQLKKNLIYLNNLALCYKSIDNIKLYEETISKIINSKPLEPAEFIELAQLLYDRKNYTGAKNILNEGIEKFPDNLLLKSAFNKLNKS